MAMNVSSASGGGGGRRRRAGRGRPRVMSEINVTPFVDVMLVLLIIFMVAAPLLTVGVPLDLPQTSAQAVQTDQEEPLALSIDREGAIFLQETGIADDELLPRLAAIAAERASDRIYLRADGSVPYARVAQVMGALSAGGFSDIVLVTDGDGPGFGAAGN
ncbi:MAG: protein TolR [Rhodobacteraceae bacterium]|nr:protein TolR [Paracoccaceae bacterium]